MTRDNRLSASEARSISESASIETKQYLDQAYHAIKSSASAGSTQTMVSYRSDVMGEEKLNRVMETLTSEGYTATLDNRIGDIVYLKIEW